MCSSIVIPYRYTRNALDSKPTIIGIQLDNYGLDRIQITDDGCGMCIADLRQCCLRHTTSKITTFDDLSHSSSYGFRGEGLFSLANLSDRIEITTKSVADTVGRHLCFDRDGNPIESTAASKAMTRGTRVVVTNLFSKEPVRRKYCQADTLFTKKVKDVCFSFSSLLQGPLSLIAFWCFVLSFTFRLYTNIA
jgi:DNA mismatch repair protein MutL